MDWTKGKWEFITFTTRQRLSVHSSLQIFNRDRREPVLTNPALPSPALQAAFQRILVPLLRGMIRMGLTLPLFLPILKAAYVEAAGQILTADKRKLTLSQLYLLTGVHRRDLRVLMAQPSLPPSDKLPLVAAVISEWRNNPIFLDDKGRPRGLPRESEDPDTLTFYRLVATLSRDVHPSAVLSELEARDLLTRLPDHEASSGSGQERVYLKDEDELAKQSQVNSVQALSYIVGGHLETGIANTFKEREPHFERAIVYDHMSQASVQELKSLAELHSEKMLNTLNQRANELALQDRDQADKSGYLLFGAFVHSEQKQDATELAKPSRSAKK